jgi:hypothetical protein
VRRDAAPGTLDGVSESSDTSDTSDVERLVRQATAGITAIASRARRFTTRILFVTLIVCVGGFLLGMAALSGGIETVWIVLGIFFGAIAIGAATTAWWRVNAVRRHVPQLADEVRGIIAKGGPDRDTVIEVFTVDDADRPTASADTGSAIMLSRQMHGFRTVSTTSTLAGATRVTEAIRALTTFPFLVLAAVMISLVFAFLGFIFLIALAL